MEPFDLEKAKAGARVCTRGGKEARIICIDRKLATPIIALVKEWDGKETLNSYFINGRWNFLGGQDDLDLMMYEKPEYQFKPFERVLVRDTPDEKWSANLFSHKDEDYFFCCVGSSWQQCIPYEGNEHLLGTTDIPKED